MEGEGEEINEAFLIELVLGPTENDLKKVHNPAFADQNLLYLPIQQPQSYIGGRR